MADISAAFLGADTASLKCRPRPAGQKVDSHIFCSETTASSCNDKSVPLSDFSEAMEDSVVKALSSSAQGLAAHEAAVDVHWGRQQRTAQRRAFVREKLLRAFGREGAWSEHLCGLCSSDCRECMEARALAAAPAAEGASAGTPPAAQERSGSGGSAAR
ncbi:unnamed protein product [Prorocentrum cordatum]|uniref:Uncharacterized protein n=1 Tax=Prorocentrum cordatum TaxID=2364126 RepID=A0ABN9S5V7_9DINO|nr:unnamed protein product [Polarella glacialis]